MNSHINNLRFNKNILIPLILISFYLKSMEPVRDATASQIQLLSSSLDVWKNNTNQAVILEDISDFSDIFDNKAGTQIATIPEKQTLDIQKQIKARKENQHDFYNVLRARSSNLPNSLIWKFQYTNTSKKLVTYLYMNNPKGKKLLKETAADLTIFLKEKNLSTIDGKVLTFNIHGLLDGDALSSSSINIYPDIVSVTTQTPTNSSEKKSWLSKLLRK